MSDDYTPTEETIDNAAIDGFTNQLMATPGFDEESASALGEQYMEQKAVRDKKYNNIAESIVETLNAE
jgi:hypothetical protein